MVFKKHYPIVIANRLHLHYHHCQILIGESTVMVICVCHRVTDSDILEAAKQGVETLDDLGQQLKVATCCGRCADCAQSLLEGGNVNSTELRVA
jgi:bacterioferritin-associated ferredoxin